MTQHTAIIVHSIAEAPERWKEKDGFITDGYNKVEINGNSYGHGTATYQSETADKEILCRSVAQWREDVAPAVPRLFPISTPVPDSPSRPPLQIDAVPTHVKHESMVDCIDLVRRAQKAYIIHRDASVFAQAVDSALRQHDATVKRGQT